MASYIFHDFLNCIHSQIQTHFTHHGAALPHLFHLECVGEMKNAKGSVNFFPYHSVTVRVNSFTCLCSFTSATEKKDGQGGTKKKEKRTVNKMSTSSIFLMAIVNFQTGKGIKSIST